MRGRTRNYLENIIAFIIFISILFGIYLLIINYTDLGKKFESISPDKIINSLTPENKNTQENITKDMEEESEDNTFKIESKKEILEPEEKEEMPKEQEESTQKEIVAPKKVEKVKEEAKEKTVVKVKVKEVVEQKVETTIKKEEPKVEQSISEEKEDVAQAVEKPKKQKSMDELIREKFSLINKFLRTTRAKINESVKNLGIVKDGEARYANIRVTVLKDGTYEQLTFMGGSKEYFDQISTAVESVFPLNIDPKIVDQFPRYFRTEIKED